MADSTTAKTITPAELAILGELERKVLWLASWTIHHANHLRESADGWPIHPIR
jgi:pyruvate dehydrogenase E1 component